MEGRGAGVGAAGFGAAWGASHAGIPVADPGEDAHAEQGKDRRVTQALLELLPKGVVGVSMALAAADAGAATTVPPTQDKSVALRLESLRGSVADAIKEAQQKSEPYVAVEPDTQLAWWGNGGWHNGGWHNGSWGNGGASWHNGGWGNGGAGWHNGFRNW